MAELTSRPRHLERAPAGRSIDVVIFAALAGTGVVVDFGSQLLIGELLLVMLVPYFLRSGSHVPRYVSIFTQIGVVFLLFVVAGGILNGADAASITTGLITGTLLLCDTYVLAAYISLRGRRGWSPICAGFALAFALYIAQQYEQFTESPWKFGLGLPVTFAVLALVSSFKVDVRLQASVLVLLSIAHVLGNYRSLALVTLTAAALVLFRSASWSSVAFRVGLVFCCVVGLGSAYSAIVSEGVLGEDAALRLEQQVGDTPSVSRLVLGARKELVLSAELISDSPIIGVGPRPALSEEAVAYWINYYGDRDLPLTQSDLQTYAAGSTYQPHSALFSGWIEGGLPGLVLFGSIVVLGAISLLGGRASGQGAGAVFLILIGIFSCLFSPIGGPYRLLLAAGVAALAHSLDSDEKVTS